MGEAYFADMPAGNYVYRASATNHAELSCQLTIKPGVTAPKELFLDYKLVTIEWSVNEITIQDKYEITLTATYQTNVPAPVVLIEPLSVSLPDMKPGDVFYGEFTLTNKGLVRADDVVFTPPPSDEFYRYEFMVNVPNSLEPNQRVTIPYRVVNLKSLAQPAATATGGGCYNYMTR